MDPGPVFYEALLYILHFSWGDTGAELVRFVSIIYPPPYLSTWAFSGSSAGKESTCNAGDLSSIPGLGRSLGEGLEYPLQYSWASLVAQMVKNPPAMQETSVRSLGMASHSSILSWRIPWSEKPGGLQSMGLERVGHD